MWNTNFFFYHDLHSRTLTTHRTTGDGRRQSFIPFYYFHPLTNIRTFILQLCTWDDYHIFLIAPLVFTSLILDEIYHLVELLFEWLMMRYWFLFVYLLISFRVWLKKLVWCHKKLELPIIKTPQSQCSGKLGLGILILSMN